MSLKDYLFYQDDWATLYCGDCLEIMPLMELGSVDLVVTDFPYGNETEYGFYQDTQESLIVLIHESLPMIFKLTNRVFITCGIGNLFKYPPSDWILAWHWEHTNSGSSKWGFNNWQPILAYGDDPYLKNGLGRQKDALSQRTFRNEEINHPCPKPLEVWNWLINRISISLNDRILDPFLGSGTTCVAAKNLNRKSIGIEIEPKYCEISVKRLRQEVFDFRKAE